MSAQLEVLPHRDLAAVLTLDDIGDDVWRSVKPDSNLGGEVFGGQYLGLSVAAAMRSTPGRLPHAMSGYFLRGASADRPVTYHVERTRDGRGFAHRRVTAMQGEKEVFRAEVSFHEWEQGQVGHEASAPAIAAVEALPSLHQTVSEKADQLDLVTRNRILNRENFSLHFRDPDEGLGQAGALPEIAAWVKPNPPPPAGDAEAYYASLAYITDACANFASRTMHTGNLYDGTLLSMSLNHGIWFHVPPGPLERVLYAVDSPFAGGGLGYNRGTIFNAQGRVIASTVQEALIRRTGT